MQQQQVAISNLKDKYQHEKLAISDTMVKLRGELKALKVVFYLDIYSLHSNHTFKYLKLVSGKMCKVY